MRPFWTAFICLLTGLLLLQSASAVTLYPTVDSRSTPSAGPVNSNTQDMTVGPVSTNHLLSQLHDLRLVGAHPTD